MRVLLIGGGNMGGAIVRGVIERQVLAPSEIGVVEVDAAKHAVFARAACTVYTHVGDALGRMNAGTQVVLAVKPQMFPQVAAAIAPVTAPRVFISVMAGLESGRIHRALGPQARIVRCMPNTPCQIAKGMSAIALGMGAREGDEALARQIFDAMGKTVVVDESLMHAVTAISGSGPAYVFLLAEAMQRAAEEVDLPGDVARMLVTQTIVGAAGMLDQRGSDAAALREAVTSPGGTTAAALRVFDERGFNSIVIEAIRAARDRGLELNG